MERPLPSYQHRVLLLILIFLVLRLVTASVLELGNDEAYYWLYSQDMQWNYFDHPPMVAVWVRLSTLNGWLEGYEVMVRLGSVIGCAFSTWFLYKAVSLIHSERAGWFAACLFNASLYAGLVAGVLVMPDSPQLFFWSFCLWQIARLMHNDRNWWTWILFGISAGLCVMSKVHGVFIWFGLGLFILFYKRAWLKRPQLYVSLLLSLLITSPIFLWNLQHDFMTWRFHSARVTIDRIDPGKDSFLVEIFQQVVVNNPINIILILMAFLHIRKLKLHTASPNRIVGGSPHRIVGTLTAYNFIALPLALLLIIISFFRDIWYHWSGPAYTTLLPLAAIYLTTLKPKRIFPVWLKWSTAYFILILIGWPIFIQYYPGTYGSKDEKTLGLGDVTLDKYGWKESGENFSAMYKQQVEKGYLSKRTPIICPTWWGAHVEYYFARPVNAPVIGLGDVQQLHQYAWLNAERVNEVSMDTAYSITASIEDSVVNGSVRSWYQQQQLVEVIPVHRNGEPVSNFYVYMLTGWKGNTEHLAAIYAQK